MSFDYENPVVRGNAPDPSVVRVGGDFFLATSSFEYHPGIVIRHSVDLVTWTIIGAAITRPAQYRRDGKPGAIMLFAPTLRYHMGRFHLACTNVADGQGNFIVSAEDPAGPWSDALWLDREAFDPSLMFDHDGTCYYTRRSLDLSVPGGNLGPIVQAELNLGTGTLGPMRAITPQDRGFQTNDIEGPHLYHIGEWYYLFSAEGGTWTGHMQTVARSKSPWGPFLPAPHNPVITHRSRVLHPIQSLGHADLVDDLDGNWWALALGTRLRDQHNNLGRETFLMPVDWREGWPHIGSDGGTELVVRLDRPRPTSVAAARTSVSPMLAEGWHRFGDGGVAERRGPAVILPFGAHLNNGTPLNPAGAVLRFQTEEDQRFGATIGNIDDGGCAGIAVYSDPTHYAVLSLRCGQARAILRFERRADDLESIREFEQDWDGPLRFEITATPAAYAFRAIHQDQVIEVGRCSARLMSAQACEWFVGVNFALVAEGPDGGVATFTEVDLSA